MRSSRAPLMFLSLLGFWQLLSGRLDPLFISLGVVCAAGVTMLTLPLLRADVSAHEPDRLLTNLHRFLRLVAYAAWLLARVPPAGLTVARVVLDPRVPTRPGVFQFRTELRSPLARTVLANSITLVPGTMTLAVEGDTFTVHAFTPEAAEDLRTGAMQHRIARAFLEEPRDRPELVWEPVTEARP